MRTIVWWTVWGLAISVGVVALFEAAPHHANLLVAIPLISGSIAAAFIRIEHEYRHALEHAKWLGLSLVFLIAGVGYVYLKANARGPFSTGTSCRALLGTTFGMSVPEVERALHRRLTAEHEDVSLAEQAHRWVLESLPAIAREPQAKYTIPLTVYANPARATFEFEKGQLAKVDLELESPNVSSATELYQTLQNDLAKEYRLAQSEEKSPVAHYRKELVDATLSKSAAEGKPTVIVVSLQYLPALQEAPAPLAVSANVF